MRIEVYSSVDDIQRQLIAPWLQLPIPTPMQSPQWLLDWWRVYGTCGSRSLCVLGLYEQDKLVAVVPWYIQHQSLGGPCIRFLGDGEVCSDHADIVRSGDERAMQRAIIDWLVEGEGTIWNSINLDSVHADNRFLSEMLGTLGQYGCKIHQRSTGATWAVDLPPSWDEYLSTLSKNHRKRCRRWYRTYVESGRLSVQTTPHLSIDIGWRELAALNRERRQHVGDRSCYADSRFHEMHRSVLPELVESGHAELRHVRLDGTLVAAEYVLTTEDTVLCYQSGMKTNAHRDGFGNLSLVTLFADSIQRGYRCIDFLRGDESYKAHWGAAPRPTVTHLVASRSLAGVSTVALARTVECLRGVKRRFANQLVRSPSFSLID